MDEADRRILLRLLTTLHDRIHADSGKPAERTAGDA
jgi:hypothetical protein